MTLLDRIKTFSQTRLGQPYLGVFDKPKAMRFEVGEGLTSTQKLVAEKTVRKGTLKDRLSEFFKQQQTGAEKVSSIGRNLVAGSLRAPGRAIASVGLEPAAGLLSLATGKKIEPEFQPKGKLQEFLLGKEPVKGILKQEEETRAYSEKLASQIGFKSGTGKGISLVTAPIFVAGLTALDLTPIGGGKKEAAKKLFKTLVEKYGDDVAKKLIATGDKALVQKATKEIIPDIEKLLQESIKPLAQEEGKIGKTYQTINEGGVIKSVTGKPVKIVDGVDTFIHQGDNPKRTIKGFVVSEKSTGRYFGSGETEREAIANAKDAIQNVGETKFKKLISEKQLSQPQDISKAKSSGQSFDEWVKGQGETVYRTEKTDIAYKGKAQFGKGKYFTDTEARAGELQLSPHRTIVDDWTPERGGVDAYVIPREAKIKEINIDNLSKKETADLYSKIDIRGGFEKEITKQGYDGLRIITEDMNLGGNQTVLFNPDIIAKIKTHSQLRTEWDKAGTEAIPPKKGQIKPQAAPGEAIAPKVEEVALPKIEPIKTPKLERGFITSAKEAVPEASKIAGQYVPRDTDTLAIKAKNLIKDDIDTAERLALTGTDDKAVATASELLKHYSEEAEKATSPAVKNALYDKAAQVANTIAPKLTESGRSIQAASILGRLTPEGQVRFAAGQISKYNEGVSLAKKIPELTGEQAKKILDEMKSINGMADGVEKAARFKKLQDNITDLLPTPLFKKIIAVWKAGLLTGLKTTGVNIFANISHAGSEIIKNAPATMADKIISLFTKKRSVAFTVKGLFKGGGEGVNKGLKYLLTGFDERNIATKLDYTKVNFGKGKLAKGLQAYTDTVFRLMGSEDQPFYYAAKLRSLYEQAKVGAINKGLRGQESQKFINELMQNPTEQMIKYASIDAETAVFQNQTVLSKVSSAITKKVPAAEIIIPFRRTPSAVAMQIINYTPVGIAKEVISQIGKKEFNQRFLSQAIGRGLTGTAVLGIGAYLFKKGLITTSRPTGEREQKLWELEGKQPNSIKIGGKWRQVQVLGPLGNVILVGASFQKAYNESGTISGAASQGLADASKAFTQQTFLTGVSNFIDAVSDPARSAKYVAGSTLASTIPTIVSDISRATDTKERRANEIFEKFLARIPGVRETLEPQVTVLGEEKGTIGNPLEIMADPTRPSPAQSTPIIEELRRLADKGFKVSPTLLGDKAGYKGLTNKQNTELWKKAGEIINSKLSNLIKTEAYKKLDDEQKGKTIDSFVDKSKTNARAGMILELTQDLQGEELKAKLSELKKSGLMTQEVFKKYLELK